MQNRPTGRKTNVTGQAKNTTTHGQASGQQPVGNQGGYQGRDMNGPSGPRPQGTQGSGGAQRPQNSSSGNRGQMTRGGGGKTGSPERTGRARACPRSRQRRGCSRCRFQARGGQ